MLPVTRFLAHHNIELLIAAAIAAGVFASGWLVRKILFSVIRRWTRDSKSHVEVFLIDSLRIPILIWFLMLGLDLAVRTSDVPEKIADRIEVVLAILWIASLTLMISRLAGNIVRFYGGRFAGDLPVTSLSKNLAQIFVLALGFVSILHSLNISVTPLLTA